MDAFRINELGAHKFICVRHQQTIKDKGTYNSYNNNNNISIVPESTQRASTMTTKQKQSGIDFFKNKEKWKNHLFSTFFLFWFNAKMFNKNHLD